LEGKTKPRRLTDDCLDHVDDDFLVNSAGDFSRLKDGSRSLHLRFHSQKLVVNCVVKARVKGEVEQQSRQLTRPVIIANEDLNHLRVVVELEGAIVLLQMPQRLLIVKQLAIEVGRVEVDLRGSGRNVALIKRPERSHVVHALGFIGEASVVGFQINRNAVLVVPNETREERVVLIVAAVEAAAIAIASQLFGENISHDNRLSSADRLLTCAFFVIRNS
jgi:hypothetical protein